MSVDLTAEEVLSFASLVTLEDDLEPYVLEWPSVPGSDGAAEAICLVVLKRQGGFLVALQPRFVPEGVLQRADAGQEAGPVGASTSAVVPGVIVENGIRSVTGTSLEVVLVDVSADLVSQMRATNLAEAIAVPFDPESPFSFQLLRKFCKLPRIGS
jgi:hypothetical protein